MVMSAPIGRGDWVECINAAPARVYETGLTVGAVYQVEDVIFCPRKRRPALILVGRRHPDPKNTTGQYNPDRFRPIYPGGELKRLLLEKPVEAKPRVSVTA